MSSSSWRVVPRGLLATAAHSALVLAVVSFNAFAQTTSPGAARLAPLPPALPRKHTPRPTGPAISVEDLKTRLYIFADDSMLGRAAGQLGNVKATDYLAAEAKKIGLRPAGDSGSYFQTLPRHSDYPMRNVVAILPGSDPVLRNEYVAIGAHSDHLGMLKNDGPYDHDSLRVHDHYMALRGDDSPEMRAPDSLAKIINAEVAKLHALNPPRRDSIFNGADDDGSGSVSVLEIAQALAAMPVRPKRSILLVWHTAEELGLWGSDYLVSHPPVPLDSIVTQLNIDMIGRGDASDRVGGSPHYLNIEGARCLSLELDTVINQANKAAGKNGFVFDYMHDYYSRSDHFNYARHGIPITFFFTDVHPDYHEVTDEPQYIDYSHMMRVATLVKDVAVRVANLDHRLRIDKPDAKAENACPNGY